MKLFLNFHEQRAVTDGAIDSSNHTYGMSRPAKGRIMITQPVHVTEIVQDVSYLRAAAQGPSFLALLGRFVPERRRPLCPQALNRRQPGKANAESHQLIVLVSGAKNIPKRRTATDARSSLQRRDSLLRTASSVRSLNMENEKEDALQPGDESCPCTAVKITFQGRSYWTRAASGSSPAWKHTITFPLMEEDGSISSVSPHSFMNLKDRVEIMVFDSCNFDIGKGGGFYDDENTIVSDKRFLGNISIPFTTIYLGGSIQGTFRLNSPDVTLGYVSQQYSRTEEERGNGGDLSSTGDDEIDSSSFGASTSGFDGQEMQNRGSASNMSLIREAEARACIDLFLMIDPIQCPPKSMPCVSITEEDDRLVRFANDWREKYLRQYPTRALPVIVPCPDGISWVVTRFLKKQPPPKNIDSIHKCSHFVGLIPQYEQSPVKIWHTSQHILNKNSGSREEHAILLANYFMHLSDRYPAECGGDVCLALGHAFPDGHTAYVMRKGKGGDVQFWDASSSKVYALEDEDCPLQNVWCLIDNENVYANLQKDGVPSQLSFNLGDRRCWMPLFPPQLPFSLNLGSIQENSLSYSDSNHEAAIKLQDELTHQIKTSIRSWRRGLTKFRNEVSEQLCHVMESLELAKLNGESAANSVLDEVYTCAGEKCIFGAPLHFTLFQKDDIVKYVEATNVHSTKLPDAEFALGVKVIPYPSNLFSIWVFVVAMSPAFPESM